MRWLLFAGFYLTCAYTTCLLLIDGYLLVAGVLVLAYGVLLWPLRRDPFAGAVLVWREGQWFVEVSGECRPIEVSGRSVCLPWLICLGWRELSGKGAGQLWLYADSAAPDQLRKLRVRLCLQG